MMLIYVNAREVHTCLFVKCEGVQDQDKRCRIHTSDILRYHVCLCMQQKKINLKSLYMSAVRKNDFLWFKKVIIVTCFDFSVLSSFCF